MGEGPNWDYPINGGQEIADAGSAGLPFSPVAPENLGPPLRILVTPDDVPVGSAEIVWVYDHPEFGRLLLIEHLTDAAPTQAQYEQLAAQEPGCETSSPSADDVAQLGEGAGPKIVCYGGTHYFTELRPTEQAFVTHGDVTTAVHWLLPLKASDADALGAGFKDPAIEVVIMGPADQLSESQAITAAKSV
jgi:hypothetical protein